MAKPTESLDGCCSRAARRRIKRDTAKWWRRLGRAMLDETPTKRRYRGWWL